MTVSADEQLIDIRPVGADRAGVASALHAPAQSACVERAYADVF
jgi:hypothetical protein